MAAVRSDLRRRGHQGPVGAAAVRGKHLTRRVSAAQVSPTLTGLAALPNLRTISLHGCTAATQAADAALNKLLKALKAQRPPRVKVRGRGLPCSKACGEGLPRGRAGLTGDSEGCPRACASTAPRTGSRGSAGACWGLQAGLCVVVLGSLCSVLVGGVGCHRGTCCGAPLLVGAAAPGQRCHSAGKPCSAAPLKPVSQAGRDGRATSCAQPLTAPGPPPEQVIILRKDVDYTLHGMSDADEMDLD